jgi:hypothetical protein
MYFWVMDKQTWTNKSGQMFTISDKTIIYNIDRQTDKLECITIKRDI